jgi:hypothetical protein
MFNWRHKLFPNETIPKQDWQQNPEPKNPKLLLYSGKQRRLFPLPQLSLGSPARRLG